MKKIMPSFDNMPVTEKMTVSAQMHSSDKMPDTNDNTCEVPTFETEEVFL